MTREGGSAGLPHPGPLAFDTGSPEGTGIVGLFSRLVFADEFVVDEKPVALAPAANLARSVSVGHDVVAAVSGMLRDQERLLERTRLLEAAPKSGDVEQEILGFIRRLLGRLDGMDRILDAFRSMEPNPEVDNWLKSLESLYFRLQEDLRQTGLIPIECVGRPVDLDCMEVVDYRPSKEYSHNTVMFEMKRGYRYKGRVLRDAQVVVAYNEGSGG